MTNLKKWNISIDYQKIAFNHRALFKVSTQANDDQLNIFLKNNNLINDIDQLILIKAFSKEVAFKYLSSIMSDIEKLYAIEKINFNSKIYYQDNNILFLS